MTKLNYCIPTVEKQSFQFTSMTITSSIPEDAKTISESSCFTALDFNSDFTSIFDYEFKYSEERKLFVQAIRNLLKRINFHELNSQFLNEYITEEEFDEELKKNAHKYVVEVKGKPSKKDVNRVINIVTSIDYDIRDFSVSDVSEMFSLNFDAIPDEEVKYLIGP